MIKRIFILCTLLLATAYLILAVTTFNSKPADQVCKGMELTVKDSIDYGFVTDKEVKEILKKGKNILRASNFIQALNDASSRT